MGTFNCIEDIHDSEHVLLFIKNNYYAVSSSVSARDILIDHLIGRYRNIDKLDRYTIKVKLIQFVQSFRSGMGCDIADYKFEYSVEDETDAFIAKNIIFKNKDEYIRYYIRSNVGMLTYEES